MPHLIDGRYEPLEVLASGGMATVWRARDTRLQRFVALKRPHPAPPDDPVHARVEREARAAASLNHPHLVTIYDVGRDGDGPYLVMELIEGPTLATVGPELDPQGALEVGAQLAEALAVVHAAGIVHRDVKPANVLMSERGPQLTDFGIALEGDATGRLTQPGAVVATPSYAAPEQLAGHPATAKSDVFSLGVIIYELVAGGLPFQGTDRSAAPPSLGDPTLDALLGRVLSPDAVERPSADELAHSLRAVAPTLTFTPGGGDTVPMAAVPPPPPPPAPAATTERRPLLLPGLAAVAVLGVVALALATADNDTPAAVADRPPLSATSTAPSTTAPATSTSAPADTTTVPPTTTVAGDEVSEARARLEEALRAPHPSDLSPKDARDLMEKVDEAIIAAEEGNPDEAGKKLRDVAKKIDDKLEGDERDAALESLVDLADTLGVSLAAEDDGKDKDD